MKWLFKWFFRFVVLVVALVVLLLLFKDSIVRAVAEQRIRARTGMKVQIGKISAGIFSPEVTIDNLKLYNTARFGGRLFLNVPELHVEFDPVALARHRLRITLMRLNVAEVDIVKNASGGTNIVNLLSHAQSRNHPANGSAFTFDGIDVLKLSLGSVKWVDMKDPSRDREFHINIRNQVAKNIRSEGDVYGLLFLLWLQSGGHVGVPPNDFTKSYLDDKFGKTEVPARAPTDKKPAAAKR